MSEISVDCNEGRTGWTCNVEVNDSSGESYHSVTVPEDDYDALTDGRIDPEELVRESFEFLLEREPRESILSEFDIMTINRYFPDYEETIKSRLS